MRCREAVGGRTPLIADGGVKRDGALAQVLLFGGDSVMLGSAFAGTEETPEGKVTAVFMKQFLGKQQQLVLTGTVDGDELHVKVDGGARQDKRIPWDEEAEARAALVAALGAAT